MFVTGYDLKMSFPALLNSSYDLTHRGDLPRTFNLNTCSKMSFEVINFVFSK